MNGSTGLNLSDLSRIPVCYKRGELPTFFKGITQHRLQLPEQECAFGGRSCDSHLLS